MKSYHPPVLTGSPSSNAAFLAGGHITKLIRDQPIFSHWFALEVYDLICSGPVFEVESETVKVGNIDVRMQSVEDCYQELLAIEKIYKTSLPIFLQENASKDISTMIVRSLDRFLFPDKLKDIGAFYHQFPSRAHNKNVETVNVAMKKNSCEIPFIPLLVFSSSKECSVESTTKNMGYAVTISEVCYPEKVGQVFLGLAESDGIYKLILYRPCFEHVHTIELSSVNIHLRSMKLFEKFLIGLYVAVHRLIEIDEQNIVPTQSCTLEVSCCNREHYQLYDTIWESGFMGHYLYRQACIVHCVEKGVVFKYYDSHDRDQRPHVETMKKLPHYGDLNLSFENLTNDGRFVRTACKYLDQGGHFKKCNVKQAVMLLEILERLHEENFVHSDVRLSNVLLSPHDSKAYLIDFDFCDKENTPYHEAYRNDSILERHSGAVPGNMREKIHDRVSLYKVIQMLLICDDVKVFKMFKSLEDPQISLSSIIDTIKPFM